MKDVIKFRSVADIISLIVPVFCLISKIKIPNHQIHLKEYSLNIISNENVMKCIMLSNYIKEMGSSVKDVSQTHNVNKTNSRGKLEIYETLRGKQGTNGKEIQFRV